MEPMANRRTQILGFAVAGVVVFVVGFAFAASRPDSNEPQSASNGSPSAVTTSDPPTPAPSGELTTDPMRPRGDDMGGLDVTPRTDIRAGHVDRSTLAMTATYDADVRLEVRTGKLHVTATIVARNDDAEPIDRLELNTLATVLAATTLEGVTVDGEAVDAAVDGQTLVVPLGGILPTGGQVRVTVAYGSVLDDRTDGQHWLFARAGGYVELYRWLPWVSRAIRWPHPVGEAYVTPVSPAVRVRLRTNRAVVVGSTGVQVTGDPGSAGTDITLRATDVRDFNLIVAEDYRVATADVDGVAVRVLTRPGGLSANTLLDHARRSLPAYGANLVPYPYPSLTIAESAGVYGMESPALVWIPRSFSTADMRYTVPHEIAHQWFYSLVGNDQATDPFADEAIGDFMARDLMGLLRASRCASDHADGSVFDYEGPCYFETVYVRGSQLFDSIRDDMGSDAFWAAVRGYVESYRNRIGSTRALFDALDAATTLNLRPRIEALLPSIY
jgi:hypothetical protein